MTRRDALLGVLLPLLSIRARAASSVSVLIGTGAAGHSDTQVNNPYGLVIGPDGALYFCDLDNQRIRRLDVRSRRTTDVESSGPHVALIQSGQIVLSDVGDDAPNIVTIEPNSVVSRLPIASRT